MVSSFIVTLKLYLSYELFTSTLLMPSSIATVKVVILRSMRTQWPRPYGKAADQFPETPEEERVW